MHFICQFTGRNEEGPNAANSRVVECRCQREANHDFRTSPVITCKV